MPEALLPDGRSLTFLLGGARSGKSLHAETLIAEHPAPWRYIATAQAFDDEMRERIALHQARRDTRWTTVNAPLELGKAVAEAPDGQPLLIDCLTLWLTNVMLAGRDVDAESDQLLAALARAGGPIVAVSNEVGLGLVPETPLGRAFRDAQGRLNQKIAAAADRVLFMAAGLPLSLK